MAVNRRVGLFGDYFGNYYDSSNPLTYEQMKVNAEYIYKALTKDGWTLNSICGMLGNMQTESSINPGRWQNDKVGGEPKGHGYSLVQWTPYTKYTSWADDRFKDPSDMDTALERIKYEVASNLQWIPTDKYPETFKEFKKSTKSAYELALMFIANYERPAEPNQPIRGEQAEEWYNYLSNLYPPIPPSKTFKTKHFKWVLYARKLRTVKRQ